VSVLRRALRRLFRNPDYYLPDALPAFPLRCQRCTAAIRLAAIHPSERVAERELPVFRDASGHIVCDDEHRILHRPMPSVL
jgi:hypothetical protein